MVFHLPISLPPLPTFSQSLSHGFSTPCLSVPPPCLLLISIAWVFHLPISLSPLNCLPISISWVSRPLSLCPAHCLLSPHLYLMGVPCPCLSAPSVYFLPISILWEYHHPGALQPFVSISKSLSLYVSVLLSRSALPTCYFVLISVMLICLAGWEITSLLLSR
jgi:hypothetical protein